MCIYTYIHTYIHPYIQTHMQVPDAVSGSGWFFVWSFVVLFWSCRVLCCSCCVCVCVTRFSSYVGAQGTCHPNLYVWLKVPCSYE